MYVVLVKLYNPINQNPGAYFVTRDMRPGNYTGTLGAQQRREAFNQLLAFFYYSHLMIAH